MHPKLKELEEAARAAKEHTSGRWQRDAEAWPGEIAICDEEQIIVTTCTNEGSKDPIGQVKTQLVTINFIETVNPDTVLKLVEVVAKFDEKIEEAHKLVNAMAGQEYWDRAEQWLDENKAYRQELNDTLSRINES